MRLVGVLVALAILVPHSKGFGDVVSMKPKATHYVKVTPVNGLVRFEYCDVANTSCSLLGKRDYSLYELRSARVGLKQAGIVVAALDTAAVAGSLVFGFGGGLFTGLVLNTTANGVVMMAYAGSGLTAGTVLHTVRTHNFWNPVRRFQEARSIRRQVAEDKDSRAWNIEKYAKRLNETLLYLN